MKVMNKSALKKMKKNDGNTAYSDIIREIAILKKTRHENVIRLYEVIDDPTYDKLFLSKRHHISH